MSQVSNLSYPRALPKAEPEQANQPDWLGVFKYMALLIALSAGGVLVEPAFAHAPEGQPALATKTTLDFAVVIPAVLRILENSHPDALMADVAPGVGSSALQRLVLASTLDKGFCVDLRITQQQVERWDLSVSNNRNTSLQRVAQGGYRLCTLRPGRYELALQHEFAASRQAKIAMVHDLQIIIGEADAAERQRR